MWEVKPEDTQQADGACAVERDGGLSSLHHSKPLGVKEFQQQGKVPESLRITL
jgi:hypothetical protein